VGDTRCPSQRQPREAFADVRCELPNDASVPEHVRSRLRPASTARTAAPTALSQPASSTAAPDVRTSAKHTLQHYRLRPRVDAATPAGRLPLAQTESAGSANDTRLSTHDQPVSTLQPLALRDRRALSSQAPRLTHRRRPTSRFVPTTAIPSATSLALQPSTTRRCFRTTALLGATQVARTQMNFTPSAFEEQSGHIAGKVTSSPVLGRIARSESAGAELNQGVLSRGR
jgi:hypothetical protein